MNTNKILLLAIGVSLFASSCRKTDVQHESPASAAAQEWKPVSSWSSRSEENATVYENNIQDSALTASVTAKGLVLVYKRSGNDVTALPFEEKATNNSYFWYYQVSEGNLTISAETSAQSPAPSRELGVRYFIISPEKLKSLESEGHSKSELMKLSLENAKAILN